VFPEEYEKGVPFWEEECDLALLLATDDDDDDDDLGNLEAVT
jgi:hypothetical protein